MEASVPARAWSLLGNSQRLDGGAMFGNVPRALWSKWIVPDEAHLIPLACRALLIEEANGRRVLFETGIGAFFEPKLRDRFGVMESSHVLLESLAALGLSDADIDVVVLSHLHFDHAGGLLSAWTPDAPPTLLFPKAQFVVSTRAWERANAPHARDRASYIPELQPLLTASGRLHRVDTDRSERLGPSYRLHYAEGHTPGLLLTEIASNEGPIVYVSDLIPGRPWVHLPITMGYDRYPERLIDEKDALLSDLAARNGRLFFTHDPTASMSRVTVESGRRGPRYSAGETWASFAELPLSRVE